ncbi:MAG TPA: 4a-hydroxytetrahydrobiopterin dehydratase [Rhodoblastus sp.]|nr:4a-hydroxytetrahydrobiopterin dehydratase [Rhodoblastus sp.]
MSARQERVYSDSEIAARLVDDLGHWRHESGAICRVYRTKDWRATLLAAGAVAHLAEAAWHHPELTLNYASMEVRLNTHSAKGITDKDFELARKIEAIVGWRPGGDGGALEGVPEDVGYILPD